MKSESYVILNKVRLHGRHGVMAQEQTVGGDFEVSLRVGVDMQQAMATDDIRDALNYATLYRLVKHEMDTPSRLLEHVAGRMARAVLEHFPQVTSIDLTLLKLNPPMGADCEGAGVELHLINDKTKAASASF